MLRAFSLAGDSQVATLSKEAHSNHTHALAAPFQIAMDSVIRSVHEVPSSVARKRYKTCLFYIQLMSMVS
jgi:hypothetical protein